MLFVFNYSLRESIVIVVRNTFSHAERIYAGQTQNILTIVTSWIFRIGVAAMVIYFALCTSSTVSFLNYIKVIGITTVIAILRHLLTLGVGWVFLSRNQLTNGLGQLEPVRNLLCVLLLPILLLLLHLHYPLVCVVLLGLVLIGFTILVITKMLLLYYKDLLSVFYILLYITCLEILPIAGMVLWAKQILQ